MEYAPIETKLGTVVCTKNGPSVNAFDFVLEDETPSVRRGEFVSSVVQEGVTVIARVHDLVRTNRYFEHAEAVREYQSRGQSLRSMFPTDRWQYTIAQTQVIGFWADNRAIRPYSAVPPGASVTRVDEEILNAFLKLDKENGLNLGTLGHHDLKFVPSMNRLLSKHLAILAMSGAGKSYFVSVLLEEILSRTKEEGRLAVVVVDVHGEYTYLKEMKGDDLGKPDLDLDIEHIRASHFQIPVISLSADAIGALVAGMSSVQRRELRKVISRMRSHSKSGYTLSDVITTVREDDNINTNTKDALIGWLLNLDDTALFGKEPTPRIEKAIRPGKLLLVDLSDFVSLKKKQILVSYLANELLYLRRSGRIPPFLLVLEEAHQFCPESRREIAIPKDRIETIAREGRKFFALLCLISQRPVKLSTTVLSQCTNQAIFRCTNPYDTQHIGRSSEGIDQSSLDAITSLEVGESLMVGEVVSVPTFVKIRHRRFEPKGKITNLLDAVREAER